MQTLEQTFLRRWLVSCVQRLSELMGDFPIVLGGNNANVLQTVKQICDVEKNEVEALLYAQMQSTPPQPAILVVVPICGTYGHW